MSERLHITVKLDDSRWRQHLDIMREGLRQILEAMTADLTDDDGQDEKDTVVLEKSEILS